MNPKTLVKTVCRSLGFDVSRLSSLKKCRNQPADDPFLHQRRLLTDEQVQVIFDVGANRGQTTRRYRQLFPNATIYCFEPFEAGLAVIREAYKDCPLVKPFQLGISDTVGTKPFYCTSESVMNSLLPLSPQARLVASTTPSNVMEIETSTLDAFCQRNRIKAIDILKMDIQGGELLALQGAAQLLKKEMVRILFTEVNFREIYQTQAYFHDVSSHLNLYGYSLYGLYQIAYSPAGPIGWADAIFVSPQVLETIASSRAGPSQVHGA
jgi:FkbM family methyltransferase